MRTDDGAMQTGPEDDAAKQATRRILVVGINYAPDMIGIAKYTAELCEALAARRHDVEIVTAPPYYPDWVVRAPYAAWRFARETRRGVRILRAPIYVPQTPSGGRRVLHHLSFAATSGASTLLRAWRFRPHVVLAIAPSLLAAPIAALAARACGARSWLHVQDFEIDAAFDLDLLHGERGRRTLLGAESAILRIFDHVSTISPKMCERLAEKGVRPDRISEARNWVDTGAVAPADRMTSYRAALGIGPAQIVALYSGNMAAKQGLEYLGGAVQWLAAHRPDIAVLLCGSGPMRPALEQATRGCANVRFLDLQPAGKLSELLATADIHLLPQRAEAADLVLPSKMSGMLASGRPIVAMAGAGTGLHEELRDVGVTVKPGDADAFARAVAALADDPQARERYGVEGREAALKRWDRGAIIDGIERDILRLTAQPNPQPLPQ